MLRTQGPHVRAGGCSPRSPDSTVHTRRKHFLDPCHSDGVPWPCQFISAALTMTYLQYMTFSDTKGWIDLTVSVKGMDGREADFAIGVSELSGKTLSAIKTK